MPASPYQKHIDAKSEEPIFNPFAKTTGMAGLLKNVRQVVALVPKRMAHGGGSPILDLSGVKIAGREVVGFGYNGAPTYVDRIDFPMPAVRWAKETAEIKELRQKEKGDWKNLTVAEKKALYRASFCQTLAELEAPTGEWKSIAGFTLISVSLAVWLYMFFRLFAYNPELPESFKPENQKAQLERMILLQIDPIEGLSSRYPRPQ